MFNEAYSFQNFIQELLQLLSFVVIRQPKMPIFPEEISPDFVIQKDKIIASCDLKFYRSRYVDEALIEQAARAWAYINNNITGLSGVLIVSSIVSNALKEKMHEAGVVIWDRSNIANFLLAVNRDDLLIDFGKFIMDAQQGTDTSLPYEDVDEDTERDPIWYFQELGKKAILKPENPSDKLIRELRDIPKGREGWHCFENKCIEILRYLFSNDLTLWEFQSDTDDKLGRFDLICRIGSRDDFWRTLVQSFYSRFILFEFKNYEGEISSGEIFTTEKYLYPKALRNTAIIIARNGANKNAIVAAKGALKEHGKLILILSSADLEQMLATKEQGSSPNDFLSDRLDKLLIGLSR